MKIYYFGKINTSFYETIISEDEQSCPDGYIEMKGDRPQGNYIANKDGEWIIGSEEVPSYLSRFQAITILKITKLSKDKSLYQATDDYINSLSDDSLENITAKTAWETAQEFKRDSSLIKIAQSMFKLTDDQVDDMFKKGAKITA